MTPSMKKLRKMLLAVEVELAELIEDLHDSQHRKRNIIKALSNLNEKQQGRFKRERPNTKYLN